MLEGSSNLLNALQEGPLAFEFLKYILMRKDLPELLNREFPKTSVLIGDELRDPALSASSVIVAQYNIGDITGGKIGIIGPTRIDYARLIPRIEYFAQMVGSILTNILDEE